jgi:hypothetical protein
MRVLLPRIALALVAVLLVAWFTVLYRDDRIGQEAADRLHADPQMSDAEWSRQLEQLRRADLLNPQSEWLMTRANYLLLRDKPAAQRLAESVLRDEPDNLDAWRVVLFATRGRDPARASEALAQIERLDPLSVGG